MALSTQLPAGALLDCSFPDHSSRDVGLKVSPQSFCDWIKCFIEDSQVGNKPTVAQWATILKRLGQVDAEMAHPMGFVGQPDPHDDPDDFIN